MKSSTEEERFPWPPVTYRGKRPFDILAAFILAALSLPLIVVIALLVKISSRGPILFRGRRMGYLGREFYQLKFRTMTVNHEGGAFTADQDPRVTAVGRMLRLFKLDELPQLLNVMKGEMSIVGPRPEDYETARRWYSREQLRVLSVRPGLTCLLQVRIFPDFTAHIPDGADPERYYIETILPERIEEDLYYVDRQSLGLDVWIVLQTAWCILGRSWKVLFRRKTGDESKQ